MDNNNNLNIDFNSDNVSENISKEEHHSHHHHHHHHSHRKKSKSSKAKRFIKRNKYKIANAGIAIMFAFVLIVLGISLDNKSEKIKNADSDSIQLDSQATLLLEVPFFNKDFVIVNRAVVEYTESENVNDAANIYKKYSASGVLDTGLPVTLSYSVKGIPEGYSVKNAELYVSENKDFSKSVVYNLSADKTSVDVYNLKTDTQYYYRFIITTTNDIKTSVESSFKTADTPRMLNVDGVRNIRDIGGWNTVYNKKIKQGLLFRSSEIDGSVDLKYKISPDGVNTMLTVLGINTEMDLRHFSDGAENLNPLGVGVEHIYYGAPMYGEVFTDSGKASIRKIFADLADENNYPVLLHCTHGLDRTGTVCYLLGAVLGVSENDLMRDYQLSAMCHGSLWAENQMNEFIGQLKSYEGSTIQQKAENYLLSAGVTSEEIKNIREIYLEK